MLELLTALEELEAHLGLELELVDGSGTILRPIAGRSLEIILEMRELWPEELEDLCEHVELLELLVLVCRGGQSNQGRCR